MARSSRQRDADVGALALFVDDGSREIGLSLCREYRRGRPRDEIVNVRIGDMSTLSFIAT